ncbi:conserved hypothetical protein [Ricinus communis]|uniref:Uncharacterized protein n=1 Tax=Ricinus communis TaxID=3988 RepID=B9SFK1_RICCO|nr:conserved hypothetical protein [Ricinus communis]
MTDIKVELVVTMGVALFRDLGYNRISKLYFKNAVGGDFTLIFNDNDLMAISKCARDGEMLDFYINHHNSERLGTGTTNNSQPFVEVVNNYPSFNNVNVEDLVEKDEAILETKAKLPKEATREQGQSVPIDIIGDGQESVDDDEVAGVSESDEGNDNMYYDSSDLGSYYETNEELGKDAVRKSKTIII